ncbi:MAG: right-handed parallel beta-helix repeat-containing protein [Clostridia bacterium]|nr:right-handed parallel beta-helix repeat-containing protein [Clostridia bacterium]
MEFYVSTNGNDLQNGSFSAPFLTLERVKSAVREALKSGEKNITVYLREGTYHLYDALTFDENDTSPTAKVTYSSYNNEKVIFSGGIKVDGWEITDGIWQAKLCRPNNDTGYYKQLFVNGKRIKRARFPLGDGTFKAVKPEGDISTWGSNYTADAALLSKRALTYNADDTVTDIDFENAELVLLQYWRESRMRVTSVDKERNLFMLSGETLRPTAWSFGYYFDNVFEGLAENETWFYDKNSETLYCHTDTDLSEAEVIIPINSTLLKLEPANGEKIYNLHFSGITFSYTDWNMPAEGFNYSQAELPAPNAIKGSGAVNCSIKNCEFVCLGGWGIELSDRCQSNEIVGNICRNTGAGFIKIGVTYDCEKDDDETKGNTVSQNLITDGGNVYLGSAAIWIGRSSNNRVTHNDISGAFQWAISVGWNWKVFPLSRARDNDISYNFIHELGTGVLGTHGALYALGVQPGTRFYNNYVRNVYSNEHWGAGEGIILDNGCSGITIENNIVYNASAGGYGSNFNCFGNIIINNIFAFGEKFQLTRYGDPPVGKPAPNGEIFARNIVVWDKGPLFYEEDWYCYSTYWDENIYFAFHDKEPKFLKHTFQEWQELGLDENSRLANPMLNDPENGDFKMPAESPAYKMGFSDIDLSQVGITLKK